MCHVTIRKSFCLSNILSDRSITLLLSLIVFLFQHINSLQFLYSFFYNKQVIKITHRIVLELGRGKKGQNQECVSITVINL